MTSSVHVAFEDEADIGMSSVRVLVNPVNDMQRTGGNMTFADAEAETDVRTPLRSISLARPRCLQEPGA